MMRPTPDPVKSNPSPVQPFRGTGGQPTPIIAPARPTGPAGGISSPPSVSSFGTGNRLDGPDAFPAEMPVYHKGTDYVSKTGPAILKKGEAVLAPKDADKFRKAKDYKDYMADSKHKELLKATSKSLGGKTSKPPKVLREVRIRKGASGGHLIEHHHTHPEEHPMEEHTTANDAAMLNHLQQAMGNQPSQGSDPDAMAQAANPGSANPGAASPGSEPSSPVPTASPTPGM